MAEAAKKKKKKQEYRDVHKSNTIRNYRDVEKFIDNIIITY